MNKDLRSLITDEVKEITYKQTAFGLPENLRAVTFYKKLKGNFCFSPDANLSVIMEKKQYNIHSFIITAVVNKDKDQLEGHQHISCNKNK